LLSAVSINGFGHWGIFQKGSRDLIGICGLNRHMVDNCELVHTNYRLAVKYQGKGFVTEAVRAVIDFSKGLLNIDNIYAIIVPENASSIKVAECCGFKFVRQTVFKKYNVNIYESNVQI